MVAAACSLYPIDLPTAKAFCRRWHYSDVFPPHCLVNLAYDDAAGLAGVALWGWGTRPRHTIRKLLDEHRSEPLPDSWWPVSVFSHFSHTDETTILGWDGEWALTYQCDTTGEQETVDLRTADNVKLPWRMDWPMRWSVEQVDFEPAGKDHHSAGGSFDTARTIAEEVYDFQAPVTFKYDNIGIKGRGGKISSSTGDVLSVADVLEVYQRPYDESKPMVCLDEASKQLVS